MSTQQNQGETIEYLLAAIDGTANLMRGMLMDPTTPANQKTAMKNKIEELDQLVDEYT